MRGVCLASVTALVLVAGVAPAAETVDNPEFATWAKHKKGTSVTLKTTTTTGEVKSEFTMTTTLVEVGKDKLVVETSTVTKADGKETKTPATRLEVTKTITLPEGLKKEDLQGEKPTGTIEEGTETLKVGGTEIKTKWRTYAMELGGVKVAGKMWTSDEVPGNVVKIEVTTTNPAGVASTTKTELTEFKKP